MKSRKIKLIGLVLSILIANVMNLFADEFFPTVTFFEDDKYLEPVITYNETPNTDLYLIAIVCSSTEELLNVKDIFIKQAVAELIRNSAFFHGLNAYQPYQQKIYVPSCITHTTTYMGLGQYSGKNDPTAFKEYPWLNEFTTCDTTKWDLLQLTLQLVNGKVVVLNSTRIPDICMNVPPTCTASNSLLNTFTTMLPDWNINPPYSNTTPFGMPANSIVVKPNIVQTYTEGTKTINYMNIYEEYALPNDLTWRAVIRKPQIREDSDSLSEIEHKGLFKQIITKTILDMIDKELVENGEHNVVFEFPDLDIGDRDIEYGDPNTGCSLIAQLKKDDNGILLDSARYINFKPDWLPEIGEKENDIKVQTYLNIKSITYVPIDYEYTSNRDEFAVGTIQGNHNVTTNGAFTYNIPIDITPGRNGCQPAVSINYNSQGSEGIAGYGWAISAGQSSISRSPKYLNIDGVSKDIQFDATDKIVYNGTKLVQQDTMPYGSVNTVYVPETGGDFAYIKLLGGGLNTNYCWFLVKMLDGTQLVYGNINQSNRMVGNKIVSWALAKVIDPNGNFYEYNYMNQDNNYLLTSIKYTGFIKDIDTCTHYNFEIDKPTYAEIQFNYNSKNDMPSQYTDGIAIAQNEVLKNIVLKVNENVYKQYNFYYESKNNVFLKKIELVGQNEQQYNATVFNYNNDCYSEELGISYIPIILNQNEYPIPPNYGRQTVFGDFNGDGFLDRVFVDISTTEQGSGLQKQTLWYLQMGKKFNGNSIEYEPTIKSDTAATNLRGFYDNNEYFSSSIDLKNIIISDIDNDGMDDIIVGLNYDDSENSQINMNIYHLKYDINSNQLVKADIPLVSNVQIAKCNYDTLIWKSKLLPADYDGDGFMELALVSLYGKWALQDINMVYYFDIVNKHGEIVNLDFQNSFTDKAMFFDNGVECSNIYNFENYDCFGKEDGRSTLIFNRRGTSCDTNTKRFTIDSVSSQQKWNYALVNTETYTNRSMDILFDPITYRGDFNGDGNEDILNIIEERIWTYLGYYGPVIRQHSLNYWDGKRFNKSDLNSIVPNYINYDHAVDSTNYHCNSYNYIADFNGDNKDDILEYNIYTRVNANQDTVYDYEYVICMPKSNGYAKFYSKRINDGDIDFSNYLIGTPLLDDHHHYSLEGGIENILKYNYDKNSFHSVSLSNKFDLTSQGRAGLYVNGKYLTFFDPKDNCKMKELYDGFGNKLEISYNHIVNDEVYTRKSHYVKNPDQSDNTQLRYINFGIEVVDSVKSIQATDTAMNNTITYKYSGAVYDRINKGFLGFDYFKSQMVTDVNRQLTLTNETIKNIFEAKAADTIRPPWYSLVTTMTRTNRPALPTADTTAGSETLSSYAKQDLGNGRFFIYAESLEDVNYNLKTRKVIFPTYNNNHQILTKRVVNSNLNFGDSVSSYIETTSYNNVAGLFGIISQVNQKNITKWQHDDASATKYTRQVNYHYYGADNNYLLKYILYDENLPQFTVCAGYSYDEYGNVLTMTQADSSNNTPILQTNQSSVEYDDLGRFPTNMTDIYGYTSYFDINYLGQPVSETDIQGNVINYHYDNMGNLEKTTFVNSLNHNITEEEFWLWGNTSCPEIKTGVYPLFQIISHTTLGFNGDTIYSFSYFDSWGREVMSKSRYMDSYDGTTPHYNSISNASVYYSNGQLQTEYDLYDPTVNNLVNNLPTRSSVPTYDAQGRMSQVNTIIGQDNHFVGLGYNGTNLSYSYGQNGNTNNQITTERTVDASGNFKNKIDALDNTVTAKYYHSGMVKETQLNTTGNKVVLSYDEIGRKKRMKDPDAGVFKYSYDVYGNMVEEIDSLISKTIYIYDVFQRDSVIRCYKYLGGSYNQLESQTNYYYNGLNANGTPSDGIGQIKRIKYLYDRTIDGRKVIDHYKKFNYNNKGLLINTIDTIREIDKISPFNSHDLIFKEEYIYDEYDRLITKKLPSISGTEGYGIELHYTYNKLDEVIKIEKYNGSGYEQVWQLAEENIYGNPVRVNLGPITNELSTYYTYNDQQMLTSKETKLDIVNKEKWELEWDVFFGNLTIRNYSLGSSSYYHEKYIYDKLDRLSDSYYGPTELPNFDSFTMDLNNFNYKKKTGYYFYEYVNDENDYSEAITLAASNAVKQIQPEWNNLVNSDVKPTHQELSYTSFNSIESISETFNRSTTSEPDLYTLKKEFYYGSGGQRVLMISLEDGVEVSRKYYTDEFEYTVDPLGNTKEVTFINSPTGLIAADVNYSNQTDKFYFVLTDQLGSITQLLKSNGDTVGNAQFTYDAWGRLRDVVNNPNSPYTPNTPQQNKFCILDRGYTGHEHLLEHDIINMNGRIYDPITAQFMQADNYIQSPEDYISYNRYAYCRYNPFKYVDPSGEDPEGPPGLTMPPTTVVGQTVKDDADDPDNFVNRDGMYPTNSIFYAGYGPPVILWGLSGLTSRGIGFTGSSNGGGSSYSTATLGNKYADDGWPKMPSDHLNQVSNSTGRRSTYSYNDFRNDAHIMLDAAGLVYDPIDVAHGLWYAYEGEYFKAGVCVFSAAPVIGIVVTSAKWAKGLKYADEAGEGIEKSFKLLDAKYLKKIGIDPHSLKKEFLGKKAQIKYYDIFKDTKTNELLIFRKGGKGTPIKTGEFIIK